MEWKKGFVLSILQACPKRNENQRIKRRNEKGF
jgi:hypothetical protein